MTSSSWPLASETPLPVSEGELIRTHRAKLAVEQEKRQQQREIELAEQHAVVNPPATRIRAWEKVHGLRLPLDPDHPVVDLVASNTRLTRAQVHDEQLARRASTPPTP